MLGLFSKKDLIMAGVILLLSIALYSMWNYASNQRDEKNRYENNYNTLKDGLTYYETKDGQIYGKAGVLELKMSEISDSVKKELKEFDIKLKNVKTIIQNQTTTTNNITTTVRDTMLFDTIPAQIATYNDKWTSFEYIKQLNNPNANVKFSTKMDLLQVVSKKPRGWNMFSKTFWKPRPLEQMITTDNPNATIKYSTIIELKRKE